MDFMKQLDLQYLSGLLNTATKLIKIPDCVFQRT